MWMMYALLSSFFAGVTAILAKCGIKNTDSTLATAIRTIIVLVFSWIMVFITNTTIPSIDSKTMIFLVLSGLATGASWLCYFKALSLGDINKVTPIDKSSTILTIILSILIFHEDINLKKICAIFLIGFGTLFMIQKKESTKTRSNAWLIYAILSAIFASLTAILGKIGISNIDSNLGTAIRTIVVLIMAWMMVAIQKKEVKHIDPKELGFILLSGLATGASWLCYYKALQQGITSVVVSIDKLSIVITILFSRIVFKEKLNNQSRIGLCSIIIGTLLLAL